MTSATFVYVSNAADGTISIYRLDRARGALAPSGVAQVGEPATTLAASPGRRHLYASIRARPYAVATFAIDTDGGALAPRARARLPDSMTYIATDRGGRCLFGASYGGDVLSVSPIDADGVARGDAQQVIETGPHPHAILPDPSNRFVYATCLGADRLLRFDFDARAGRLAPGKPLSTALERGTGPRHFAFAPDGRFVFVLGELAGTVTSFALDAAGGAPAQVDAIEAVAGLGLAHGEIRSANVADATPRIWASDIRVRPDGRFLYIAERTSSTVATLACDARTGRLAFVGRIDVETQPRGFAMDRHGGLLIVAGERSGTVGVYAIDAARGTLAHLQTAPAGRGAAWVEIVELDATP